MILKYLMRKKLLYIMPLIIMVFSLIYIDYTINYFKSLAYNYVYDINKKSVQTFSGQLADITSRRDASDESVLLFTGMIFAYNITIGEKDPVITFVLDELGTIHHSNDSNKEYLTEYLENENNLHLIQEVKASSDGLITLAGRDKEQTMFYQAITNGKDNYHIFMCVDRANVEDDLNANEVIVPICIICLLLLLVTEYTVWLKLFCEPCCINGKEDDS